MDQVIQIGGALLILAAFAGVQFGRMRPETRLYLGLNLAGSAILAVLAARRLAVGLRPARGRLGGRLRLGSAQAESLANKAPSGSSRSLVGSALFDLEVADHADPEAEPRVGVVVEEVVLGLEADRREPQLVGGGVGDAAVQPAPDPAVFAAGRRRSDRVGPLDRVAALFEGSPRRGRPAWPTVLRLPW